MLGNGHTYKTPVMIDDDCKKTLKALWLLFDSKVLTIQNKKIQFSGKVFEYEIKCEAHDGHELIQQIGDFLNQIPKYMWNLKNIPTQKEEN